MYLIHIRMSVPSTANPAPAHDHSHAPHKKRRHRATFWLLVVGVLCLPLLIGGAIAGAFLGRAYAALQRGQTAAMEQRVDEARTALEQADTALNGVEFGSKALLYWRYLPVLRSYVFTLDESIAAGRSTLQGVQDLLDVAELVQEAFTRVGIGSQALQNPLAPNRSFKSLTQEEKRMIFARLSQALPAIRSAQEQMRIAALRWQSVPRENLSEGFRRELEAKIEQFSALQQQFDQVVRLAEVFLPMSGYPEPKKYLVILQNNQEMRGTGGFIGTVGEVWVNAGNVEKMVFQDVYSIDLPVSGVWKLPSPAPIARWLEQKNLFLRDANWSPDVPTTADLLLRQYEEQRALAGVPVPALDGLILFEPDFFKRILAILGPVTIEDQEFRADNFFDALQYDVHMRFHQEGIPTPQRKEVVAKLGDAVFQRLTDVPVRRWPEILEATVTSLEQRDVMIFARDQELQRALDARDWTGKTKPTPTDYLRVIDTNMGALKTDGVMDKQILYGLDASNPNELRATVTLRYRNTNATPNWRYTRYRNYVRVYVPEGSELLASAGAMEDDLARRQGRFVPGTVDVYKDLGKTVFGAFFAVEPGKTGEIQFTYRLPASSLTAVRNGSYELLVQKQPGSYARFVMDGRFPAILTQASPAEDEKRFGDAAYQNAFALDRDTRILIQW